MSPRLRLAIALLFALPLVVVGARLLVLQQVFVRIEPAPLAVQPPVEGLASRSAETCRGCHPDQYVEWAASRMGQAMTDPVFLADFREQGEPFVCLRCHAPLPEQQPVVVTGLASLKPLVGKGVANPDFDPELAREGVTCVVCHQVGNALHGPIEDPQGAPHATGFDPDFGAPDRCVRCHQLAPPPLSGLERPLPDTHGEHERWQAKTGRTERCVDCHMPPVERPAAVGGPVRSGRRHRFGGAFDPELVQSALTVDRATFADGVLQVVLTNHAGHELPTAEPARAVVITAYDASGAPLGEAVLARRIPLPRLREAGDNALRAGETRTLTLLVKGRPARVDAALHTLRFLPPGVARGLLSSEQQVIQIAQSVVELR